MPCLVRPVLTKERAILVLVRPDAESVRGHPAILDGKLPSLAGLGYGVERKSKPILLVHVLDRLADRRDFSDGHPLTLRFRLQVQIDLGDSVLDKSQFGS